MHKEINEMNNRFPDNLKYESRYLMTTVNKKKTYQNILEQASHFIGKKSEKRKCIE